MDALNLRTNSFGGHVKYDVEWGYLYDNDCKTCNLKNECNGKCKHKTPWKFYVMKIDEGVGRIKESVKMPSFQLEEQKEQQGMTWLRCKLQ